MILKTDNQSKSLSECLEPGPNQQKLTCKMLVGSRFNPIAIFGNLQQIFFQIRIQESCRDLLRFHWIQDRDSQQIVIYRFTELVFGLMQSPFVLGTTLQHHLEKYINTYAEVMKQIIDDLYVDNLIT